MREADGLALGNFSYPHPMFGPLDLYQWLVFVGLHESRHACQIRELGETRFDPYLRPSSGLTSFLTFKRRHR